MPIKTGRVSETEKSKSSGGENLFISIKGGESVIFYPLVGLDDMLSTDLHEYWLSPPLSHPCSGEESCPGCMLGNDPRLKCYLPVVTEAKEVKIWSFTITSYNQLELLDDELDEGGIKGFKIKFSRVGSGKNDTRYTVMGLGSKKPVDGFDIPDIVKYIGPLKRDEQIALLTERDLWDKDKVSKVYVDEIDKWDF